MKKNKVMKALLVFGMSAITATSIAGLTACGDPDSNPNPGPTPPAHTHTGGDVWGDHNDTQHWHICSDTEYHDGSTYAWGHENHTGTESCSKCGWEKDGGDVIGKDPVVVDFTANTTEAGAIAEGLGITTTSAIEIKDQNRKVVYKNVETQLAKGLKMNGAAKATEKSFKVELPEDATILVYAASGSGTADTYLSMLDAEGTKVTNSVQQVSFNEATSSSYAHPAVFEVKANTVCYIGSDGSGSNAVVFRIAVIYGTFTEAKGELVPAKTANCTEDGNIAYYKTEYGRYLNESSEVVGPKVALQYATGHKYVQDGELTVIPAATTPGNVALKCENDPTHVVAATDVVLPPLETEGAYKRVTNASDSTKTDYTYVHPTYGATITFTTDSVDEKAEVLTSYHVDFSVLSNFTSATDATSVELCPDGDKTNTGTNREIKFADGKKTGLTAVCTKNDAKKIVIDEHTVGETTSYALNFGGSIAKDKNCVSFVVPNAGEVTITVKYFNSNAGRYIDIMNTSGSVLASTTAAVDGKVVIGDGTTTSGNTTTDGNIITATITLDVNANTTLLLGSHNSGIWVTYLDVQWTQAS